MNQILEVMPDFALPVLNTRNSYIILSRHVVEKRIKVPAHYAIQSALHSVIQIRAFCKNKEKKGYHPWDIFT